MEEADRLAAKIVEAADSGVAARGLPNVPNLFAPHAGDVQPARMLGKYFENTYYVHVRS